MYIDKSKYEKVCVPPLERCEHCDLNGVFCTSKTKKEIEKIFGKCLSKKGKEYAWKLRK